MTQPPDEEFVLRSASVADAARLYQWRMDPATRAASLNTAPIEFEGHHSWLVDSLADPDRQIYVAEHVGVPVGTVRADRRDDVWHLSWTVAPEFRGRRFGSRMVRLLVASISGPIEAVVRSGNVASIRIAEASGLHLDKEEDGVLRFFRGPI
jgi:RimJ/RimL family protein N-acetyltransferase